MITRASRPNISMRYGLGLVDSRRRPSLSRPRGVRAHRARRRPVTATWAAAHRHGPQRAPLDQVRHQGEEVEHPRGRDGLVAQGLPLASLMRPPVRRTSAGLPGVCRESTTDESTRVRSPPPERSSAATSTRVVPPWRRARTQTRRGLMNSDPSSPTSARTTPSRVSQTSGVRLIWRRVQCLTLVKGHRSQVVGQLHGLAGLEVDAEHLAVGLVQPRSCAPCRARRPTAARRSRCRGRRRRRASRCVGLRSSPMTLIGSPLTSA